MSDLSADIPPALPSSAVVPPHEQTFIERHGISPLLFAYIALAMIFLLYQIVGGGVTLLVFGLSLEKANPSGLRFATGVSQVLFILVPTLLLVRLATKRPWDYLRLSRPRLALVVPSVIGILSLQQMLQIYLLFQDRIPLPGPIERAGEQFRQMLEQMNRMLAGSGSLQELVVVLVLIAVIPAFVEELLFRGLVLRGFQHVFAPGLAAVLSGIIFGAYHVNPFAFVALAGLGVYLGFVAIRGKSLWLSVIAHFANNAAAVIALHFHMNENAIVTGDLSTMSFQGIVIAFLGLLGLFAASLYWFIRASSSDTQEYAHAS